MRLIEVAKRYEDGKMDVRTQGIGLIKIEDFHRTAPDKLYPSGDVIDVFFTSDPDIAVNELILGKLGELHDILMIKKKLPESPGSFITFDLAHMVGFSIDQELELLTIKEEKKRQTMMLEHLNHIIPVARQMKAMRLKAKLNGHFKNVIPPDF